jgi:hypothetical protein
MERNSVGKLVAAYARANSEGIEQNRATGNYIKVFYLRVISNCESSPTGLLHKTKLHFVGTN